MRGMNQGGNCRMACGVCVHALQKHAFMGGFGVLLSVCCDPAAPALLQGFCQTIGCDYDEYTAFKVSWKALFVASALPTGANGRWRDRAKWLPRWQGGSERPVAFNVAYANTWRD